MNVKLLNYYLIKIQYLLILVHIGAVRIGAYSNDGGITFNKIKVLNTLVQPLTWM